jgi:hypothetical protein
MPGKRSRLEYAGLPVCLWGSGNLLATNTNCLWVKTSLSFLMGSFYVTSSQETQATMQDIDLSNFRPFFGEGEWRRKYFRIEKRSY